VGASDKCEPKRCVEGVKEWRLIHWNSAGLLSSPLGKHF
jgi:hypothetical protein